MSKTPNRLAERYPAPTSTTAQSKLLRILSVAFALILWQVSALLLRQSILLVGPIAVLQELWVQCRLPAFWLTILFSLWRIALGFFLALIIGAALAALSYRFKVLKVMLWPYIAVIKSTPVASFIILCLIWLSAKNLSVFVSFLIVLPVVYSNILQGLLSTDIELTEMAKVFRLSLPRRVKYIYLPQLKPYLLSACSVAIGMAWKSGVAAEVIGIPKGSIGERLYEAKIYLSSKELFAWTVVVIVISVLFEKLFIAGLKRLYRRMEGGR